MWDGWVGVDWEQQDGSGDSRMEVVPAVMEKLPGGAAPLASGERSTPRRRKLPLSCRSSTFTAWMAIRDPTSRRADLTNPHTDASRSSASSLTATDVLPVSASRSLVLLTSAWVIATTRAQRMAFSDRICRM